MASGLVIFVMGPPLTNPPLPSPNANNPLLEFSVSADAADEINRDQMFRLLDTILPLEACWYHQVLPLSVEGKYMKLGMVDLDDEEATSYVRRALGHIHCTLLPRPISLSLLQHHLGEYQQQRHSPPQPQAPDLGQIRDPSTPAHPPSPPVPPPYAVPTALGSKIQTKLQTSIPDSPPIASPALPTPAVNPSPDADPAPPPLFPVKGSLPHIPTLKIQTYYLTQPIETLTDLPPHNLLQELLGRALVGGIGRLYFEEGEDYGHIFWSQSGVVQSVLDHLDLILFHGVMQALKALVKLPLEPVTETQNVELERIYLGKRLLLRIRIRQGDHGERATLQVLRGVALKFYEQQQVNRLEKDALQIAQQLQRKLTEIRSSHSHHSDDDSQESLATLAELNATLKTLHEQIQDLEGT